MNRSTHALCTAACLALATSAQAQTSVDLNTWTQQGPSGNGNWLVENAGDSVFQTINGQPTYFVSPNDFFNTTIQGSFLRNRNRQAGFNDNDFIGFVFGFNSPPGEFNTDATFYLLDWKRGNQSGTEEGFRLSRVNGTDTPPFGNAENDNLPNYDVLATNTGSTLGWENNIVYDFELLYTADRIKIDITGGTGDFENGLTVFDLSKEVIGVPAFETGRFGFYNHSQQGVEYRSFTLTEPVLGTTPGDTGTLEFLARVGTTDTQDILVTNAGGPGTLITGNAGLPAVAEFAGPVDTAFSLTDGQEQGFSYTFSPAARTAGTPVTDSVDIASNQDGTHLINLSGTAVGPVAEFEFESEPLLAGDTLDFGSIVADETTTIDLNILNTSTDAVGRNLALSNLTILDITITGDDADHFELVNDLIGNELFRGSSQDLTLLFDPALIVGDFNATLTIFTDEDAPLAGDGTTFTFNLVGNATEIPEPALSGLLGLALLARRRK
ncbi:hypothetical protein [Mucisphaera sp.]|uniref:hypothetical protein n=1 Tax=Mucisphaera sp. TaxID=2913024 RepID=UPI003D1136A2